MTNKTTNNPRDIGKMLAEHITDCDYGSSVQQAAVYLLRSLMYALQAGQAGVGSIESYKIIREYHEQAWPFIVKTAAEKCDRALDPDGLLNLLKTFSPGYYFAYVSYGGLSAATQ